MQTCTEGRSLAPFHAGEEAKPVLGLTRSGSNRLNASAVSQYPRIEIVSHFGANYPLLQLVELIHMGYTVRTER